MRGGYGNEQENVGLLEKLCARDIEIDELLDQ